MPDWDPALYLRFAEERTRPATELLARVPLRQARRVVDLGCGPGNSTELLVRRFPQAQVLGVDHSPAMLERARQRLPQATFVQADIASWAASADAPAPDLIYANAALQWVANHGSLLPRLLGRLAPGGVLAVQMPDNLQEPSHSLMRELAQTPPYDRFLGAAVAARAPLLSAAAYYDLFAAPCAATQSVDLWHTVYRHRMASAAAIVEWFRATGLKPFVEGLPAPLQAQFLADYEQRIDEAYPVRADGQRLLAFPRLFFVIQRQP